MESSVDRIECVEINENGIDLYSTNGFYGGYSIPLFLCEIFEKLNDCFVNNQQINEFFNYYDTKSAWELLTDFLEKTDYLNHIELKDLGEYQMMYSLSLDVKIGEYISKDTLSLPLATRRTIKRFSRELEKYRITSKEDIENGYFNPNVFFYKSCESMRNFVFALLHHYVYNGYRIVKCKHCGRLFATNESEDYCSRFSPFSGYEDYTCKEAVRPIKNKLQARYRTEYERLRKNANNCKVDSLSENSQYISSQASAGKMFFDFCKKCDDFKAKIKKGASVQLLKGTSKNRFEKRK